MGLAGAMLPVAVKERFSDRPGFATGVYATGMTIGAAIASRRRSTARARGRRLADAAARLRCGVDGARSALALADPEATAAYAHATLRPLRLPLRNPLGWQLVAAFSLMSFVFYGLNSWLPDAYVERGWSQSSAGGLLAVLNTITIPVGFAVAWAADHIGRGAAGSRAPRRLQLVALLGLVLHPERGLDLGGAARDRRSARSSRSR